jgi:phage terminase large subunit
MIVRMSKKYQPLWKPKTRYVLMTGGRGSQKSFAVSSWACNKITDELDPWIILYTRYTMQSAEISVIPEFTEKIELLGKTGSVQVTKTLVECLTTGSKIIFSGIKTQSGNQTARLKSIPGLNVFIVDEAEEFRDEKDFNTIDDSIRMMGVPNVVIIVMNPQDTEHWVWNRWFEKSHRMELIDGFQIPMSTHPEVTHIHTTWYDNRKNLNPDYLEKIKILRTSDPAAYAHRYLGQWLTRKEGVIYPNWIEGEFDLTLPYGYGLDFGFTNPDAMCKVAVDDARKLVYLHEEMYATKQSNETIKTSVSEIGGNDLIVADSNEPRTIEALQSTGLNVQKVEKYPGCVVDRIRILSDYTWVVTPESYNAKFEFNNYIWNDKKASIPLDKNNHLIKAGEYIATRLLEGSTVLAYSK